MSSPSSPANRWPSLAISLPAWIADFLPPGEIVLSTPEERMDLAIRLASENVRQGTGGPFGAAIFEQSSGRLVAPGVNLVLSARWSGAHAEMIAFAVAQQVWGSHDLGAPQRPACELVSSVEPCAMCLGAIPWSGVHRVVFGARDADARAIGFNEGHKPRDWPILFGSEGIEVRGDVCRAAAVKVLRDYAAGGGPIYNGRGR